MNNKIESYFFLKMYISDVSYFLFSSCFYLFNYLFNCRWLCSHCFGHSKFKWQILSKINSHPDDCCGNSHPKLWSQIQILYNWMIFFDKLSEFSKYLKPDCIFTQVLLWFSPTNRGVWVYNYQYFLLANSHSKICFVGQ